MNLEEQFLQALLEIKESCKGDPEAWHGQAENVMLDFLEAAGYTNFAKEYKHQSENWWYA